jgi:hypothetical protein
MKWNFAYGSNLHPKRVRERADVALNRCERAVLRDWRLAFNLATGMQWVEPAMANIVPAPGEEVHGVAIQMSDEELARLTRSEGGTRFYRSVSVEVDTYDGERIAATVFVAREDIVRDEVAPSLRYLTLLREGARHHGLEEDYRAFLEAHDFAEPHPLSPYVSRLFRSLDAPRARPARDAFIWLIQRLALLEARRARWRSGP